MSCLFNSLSCFVNENPTQLRNKICNYLQENHELMDGMDVATIVKYDSGKSLLEYVKHMRETTTWGGAIEIRAFCNLYKKNVIVTNIRNNMRNINNKIEFINENTREKINKNHNDIYNFHISWNGGHYEALTL